MRVQIPDTTLCCVDCITPQLALLAMLKSMQGCDFPAAVLLTDTQIDVPAEITRVAIPPIGSKDAYSDFMIKKLGQYVATPYVLLVQWDGFVVNPQQWRPEFLEYDYIGAIWPDYYGGGMGNGGFSLRSRRLLDALQDPEITDLSQEDVAICKRYRPLLEERYGIRFAPESLAREFAYELSFAHTNTFGFHGPYHLWRYWDERHVQFFLDQAPPKTLLTNEIKYLIAYLQQAGRHREAMRILGASLRHKPDDEVLLKLMTESLNALKPAA